MLQITLMTLHFLGNHGGQSLAARHGLLAIFFLGMYHAQGLDGAVMARKRRASKLGGCQATQGIRAAYSQSTRASTGSVLLRSPRVRKAASATRIDEADFYLAVSMQSQGQIEAVIAAGFQADADALGSQLPRLRMRSASRRNPI